MQKQKDVGLLFLKYVLLIQNINQYVKALKELFSQPGIFNEMYRILESQLPSVPERLWDVNANRRETQMTENY